MNKVNVALFRFPDVRVMLQPKAEGNKWEGKFRARNDFNITLSSIWAACYTA
jgi:hypothetical protein